MSARAGKGQNSSIQYVPIQIAPAGRGRYAKARDVLSENIVKVRQMAREDHSLSDIAREFGVSLGTVFKFFKQRNLIRPSKNRARDKLQRLSEGEA